MMFKVLALNSKSLRELAYEQKLCMPYSIACYFYDFGNMKSEFDVNFLMSIKEIINPHLNAIQTIKEDKYFVFGDNILIDLNDPIETNLDLTLLLLTNSDLKVDKSCLIMKVIDKSIESRPGNHILYHCIYLKEEIDSNAEKWIKIEDTANKHTFRVLKTQFSSNFMDFIKKKICKKTGDFGLSLFQFIPKQNLLDIIEDKHINKKQKKS